MNKKGKTQNGITLIALIITVIVMLILVAVTISMAVNGGLFDYAGKAVGDTKNALNAEQQLSNGAIKVDGVWYDSIDDYINKKPSTNQGEIGGEDEGEEGPVSITLSIAGTKVTEVPLPSTDFEHVEGTIETGYVIRHKTDGNEFVWVPVDKDQKITLKIKSEKDVTEVKLYDPYGDEILTLANDEIETAYSNEEIAPTINGIYTAKVTTEEGTETKAMTVKSLYAIDTYSDWYNSDEYVKSQGFDTKQEMYQAWADDEGYASIEEMLQDGGGYSSIEEYELDGSWMKEYEDLVDYTESVNNNGGFYVARYEAGATTARTSGSSTATVDEIKTANGVPVSKEGYAPYNYITHEQAKGLAESMYEENDNYTISLLTGSAWDRTLGWIYETGNKSMRDISGDSGSWGNYDDVSFDITTGKYSENHGTSYTDVSGTYTKPEYTSILLTTGASTRNSSKNIFDLAGNVDEWTNEAYSSSYRVTRGGGFNGNGSSSGRGNNVSDSYSAVGFRPALYIK